MNESHRYNNMPEASHIRVVWCMIPFTWSSKTDLKFNPIILRSLNNGSPLAGGRGWINWEQTLRVFRGTDDVPISRSGWYACDFALQKFIELFTCDLCTFPHKCHISMKHLVLKRTTTLEKK